MTTERRLELLAEATREWEKARAEMAAAKEFSKAWSRAADRVENWSNKMAVYFNPLGW